MFVDRTFLIRKTDPRPHQLDNEKMSGAYSVLVIGLAMSFLIFIGEVFYAKFKRIGRR